MPVQAWVVSFTNHRQIRHRTEVLAESVYEAVVMAVRIFGADPFRDPIGSSTVLEVEAKAPWARHSISVAQVERYLSGASTSANEKAKKEQLRVMLVQGLTRLREA
jgi:hypothetical protein